MASGHAIIDLFCGAGGFSEGFRQEGFRVLGGIDIDPDACATFAANFPEAACICGDLRAGDVLERVLVEARRATVIVGGPPCQAFSQVRNHSRLIQDPRNSLYREFARVVHAASPPAFVMENVLGMDQMGVRDQVIEDLGFGGNYRVACSVLDAVDFGVPQTRRRMVFVGVRSDVADCPPFPQGSGASQALLLKRSGGPRVRYRVCAADASSDSKRLLERAKDPEDSGVVTVEKAISDLAGLSVGRRDDAIAIDDLPPPLSRYQRDMRAGITSHLRNVCVPRLNQDTGLRLKAIPPGGNHLDLAGRLKERYLTGQKWGPDSGSGRLARRHYYAYRRLHAGLWSWTLNTKADSVYHYREARALSVREFARLQSFPDRFVFTSDARRGALPGRIEGGAAHSRYRQVGNAVPPKLARAIAASLCAVLAQKRVAQKRVTA